MKNINSTIAFLRGICQRVSMIPLSLKLVEQVVQPEGFDKIAYVLNLTCPYSLAEIQRYAQVPPGRALLPPPDSEAPDDLFPREVFRTEKAAKTVINTGKELTDLWTRVKSKVWQLDVRDAQIADWFNRNYRLDVRLSDFDLLTPPPQITLESLDHFLKTLEHHAEHI